MKKRLLFSCRCGEVQGEAHAPGPRIVCMCDDCQSYAHFLGDVPRILDANGGSDVVPVRPAHLRITRGAERIACMRLGPKGTYRWYAACCRTPIANTMASRNMPYAGLFHLAIRDGDAGPVRARVQARHGMGELPAGAEPTVSFFTILKLLRFMLPGFILRQHRPSPFFDERDRPIVEPQVLTLEERNALRRRVAGGQ
ncbi:MAG TPA: DUF6151 family protein [Gammaproteobacteria bacterium]|nr:DUF6151 family protein [Gammaproteobacteria bacterium]